MQNLNYVTSPEQNVQHGSSNQASISNILQQPPRSNTISTRTIPSDLEQNNQPATKRRKSGTVFVNPQPDQSYMQQGQYQYQTSPPTLYFMPTQIQLPNLPHTMPSRNNNNLRYGFSDAVKHQNHQRSKSNTINSISNNIIFNNNDKNQQTNLPSSSQVLSNQINQHVPIQNQMVGFQNLNNPQQQMLQHGNNQGQMQPIQFEMLRTTPGQIALYPLPHQQVQQIQQIQPTIHTSPILENQMYINDTSNIQAQDSILFQRLEAFKADLENKDLYPNTCEELSSYLHNNENIYSSQYHKSLVACLKIIKNHAFAYGFDIAMIVFRNVMNNLSRFNTAYQTSIKQMYDDLNKSSPNINGRTVPQRTGSLSGRIRAPQQQQQQVNNTPVNPPRIEQRPISDIEKANANWISRIIDRAWGHVMLPYESQIINQHQAQQEFVNSFYVSPDKFDRIWKVDTPFPPVHTHPNKLPISYRLISRKPVNLDDDNKCDWPPEEATFKIHINDSEVKLPRKQRIPIKQNQYSFVGVDKPVDIVQYLVSGANRIKITQCMCEPCRQQLSEHILSIEILVKETEEIVLRNARSQKLTTEHGKGIVKRLISGPSKSGQSNVAMLIDDDCDVTVNKMKVSLRCPISLLRISEPAKGQNCRHIGCFDLKTYVNVNKKNCKWRCPECNDRVTSETLRIDEYFKELLRQIPDNVNTVELDSSGEWTVVGQEDGDCGDTSDDDEAMQIDPSSKSAPSTIIILDDDDDEPVTQPSNTFNASIKTNITNITNMTNTNNTNNNTNTTNMINIINPINTINTSSSNTSNNQQQVQNNTPAPTYSQPQRPTAIRQSSTPGVPYMQPIRPTQTSEQLIQSPPLSANINVMQSPPETTTVMFEPIQTSNHANNISRSKRKRRQPRRGGTGVASQEKGNSSTKDDNNNNDDNNNVENSSGRLSWSYVMGINSSQDYHTLLSQDIVSQNATQVASPISPNSVTNPNFSHRKQDEIEEGEWLTEDEQEEVVLDSSSARNSVYLR